LGVIALESRQFASFFTFNISSRYHAIGEVMDDIYDNANTPAKRCTNAWQSDAHEV